MGLCVCVWRTSDVWLEPLEHRLSSVAVEPDGRTSLLESLDLGSSIDCLLLPHSTPFNE